MALTRGRRAARLSPRYWSRGAICRVAATWRRFLRRRSWRSAVATRYPAGRAGCGPGGRGFESPRSPLKNVLLTDHFPRPTVLSARPWKSTVVPMWFQFLTGRAAASRASAHNPKVAGSNARPATRKGPDIRAFFFLTPLRRPTRGGDMAAISSSGDIAARDRDSARDADGPGDPAAACVIVFQVSPSPSAPNTILLAVGLGGDVTTYFATRAP
jgi:hypothetical protein